MSAPDGFREALRHLERGFALLPVQVDKEPARRLIRATRGTSGWRQLVRSPAPASEVHAWFELDPSTGVGVLTGSVSSVVVFDVDVPAAAPALPTTATVKTSRGFHAYFRTDSPVRTRELEWGSVRGDRAYVVAPCSLRVDGGRYAWELAPEEAGLADFDANQISAGSTYIRTSSFKGTSRPALSLDGRLRLADLERDEALALRLGRSLGVPEGAGIGESFPCLLHVDGRPSASLWRYEEDAGVLYRDWHAGKHGEAGWLPLALVRARLAGREGPLAAPELAVWKLRLAAEAELLEPLALERPSTPSPSLDRVWQGFLDLLALRWAVSPGNPTTYSARFAAAWCGVSKRHAHEAISALARSGSLRLVGRDPHGTRLWLPQGVVPIA